MDKINVHLLGRPYVEVNGERINFPYKKAEGFFYYLCVKKTATREEIIYVLWGADIENVGRKNLREAVYQIKKLLGKEILVTAGHTSISLNPERMPEIDWDRVTEENILEQEEEGFLSHFHIKNSYEFEEWIADMQEQYNQSFMKCARKKMYDADAVKDVSMIQKYSNILLKHDPYNEKLYQEVMELYAANGSYNMAIKLFYDLEKVLSEELGVEPSPEVTELFHRIFNVKGNVASDSAVWNLPFTGRTEEIYKISQCIAGSARMAPQCVAIGGEEGVGKTALLEKAKQMVKGSRIIPLSASCYQEEEDFFLRPWNDIFWETEQNLENGNLKAGVTLEQKAQLKRMIKGTLKEEGGTGRLTYQMVEQAVIDLFREVLRGNRIALFFDDIQWLDAMSFQLLNRVMLTFGTEKVLLLCAYNQNYDAKVMEALEKLMKKGWLEVIHIQSFTREQTNELLHKYLPQLDREDEKRENIYQMTDGNAFFLLEMINLIREKGYTLEISPKTNHVIKARLAGLCEEENEVLDCMSLFPEKIKIEELELLLPHMDRLTLLKILEKLQERHLIQEVLVGWNIYYKFVHRVFREYLYERQSMGKKRMYHQMLAEYYEDQVQTKRNFESLPMIIHHYEKCHNQVKTYWYKIQYLKEYYTIINENFPVLHWEIEYGRDNSAVTEGDEEMLKIAEEVIRLENNSHEVQEMKMEMYYVHGRYHIAVGEYEEGIHSIKKSIRLARNLGQRQMLLSCYRQMCFYGIQVENLELTEKYINAGLAALEPEETEDLGAFERLRGWCLLHRGKYSEAEDVLWDAMGIFEDCQENRESYAMSIAACYNYLGDICRQQENYEKALEYYRTAVEKGTGKVITNGLGQFYSNIGQIYHLEKNLEKAEEYLEKAISCLKSHGYLWGLERTEAYMAMVKRDSGKMDEAKEHYLESWKISEKIKNPTTLKLLKEMEGTI